MNTGAPEISISVCERDIDFFLVEEFVSSAPFVAWFMNSLGLSEPVHLIDVSRSVTTSTGESDLEVTIAHNDSITKVLIENKVDACLQPRQAERYAERGESYCANGKCSSVITVLVAPARYVGTDANTLGFHRHLSYESMLDWYAQHEAGSARVRYKCELLRRAIDRSASGYRLIPDETSTSFWEQYWKLAHLVAPELQMSSPVRGDREPDGCISMFAAA